MIQAVGYDLPPLNCLYIKIHVIWIPLANASSGQKLDNLSNTTVDYLMHILGF